MAFYMKYSPLSQVGGKSPLNWIKDVTEEKSFDKGGLHEALGVPEGEKIPCGKLRSAWKNRKTNGLSGKLTFAFNTGSKACRPADYGKDD